MKLPPWLDANWQRLAARAAAGTLPHAMLLAGPPGIGKRAFAERFAAFLLCQRRDAAPCGECRSCRLFAVRAQRDPEELRPDGSRAHPEGHPGHPDAKFVGFVLNERTKKPYTEIVVEQVRELSAWLALTSQLGGAQVGLIEPADAMNTAAANALLKTLEEPSPGRYLMLVSAHPARLPATIRSRCQRVDFALPPAAAAQAWLVDQGLDAARAAAALAASGGNPGLALAWAGDGRLALRDQVAGDLRTLAHGRGSAAATAAAWGRDDVDARLWFAASLAEHEARAHAAGNRGPLALTAPVDLNKLAAWFEQANRARELLRGPLRADLMLAELLLAWQALAQPARPAA